MRLIASAIERTLTSDATPTIRAHVSEPPMNKHLPSASPSGQRCRAMARLTTVTGSAPPSSEPRNGRPSRISSPSARK
jgi:hypothetical protein